MNGIESLINAIAENPIVSAALLWLIGAVLSRVFKNGERKSEIKKKTSPRHKAHKPQENQVQETVQTVYERVQREHNRERARSIDKELSVVRLDRKESRQNKAAVQNPAVQGIIWAEIIGQPRSVNPHYTRRRK
ncbi:hypothetical protein [Bacillus sp. SJS]|uniref:hypothetical protein n=1 Tax=Bacillus sp. SJS TaxID=1423321 RepID=UPI0004DD6DD2|nr:hypothetical protein [Bacillus sp. SJS]KZZ85979.1 hypothetical protein AS29_002010 [Bacillus sp. SJS]